MIKTLIITNLLYGSFDPGGCLSCYDPYVVSNYIVGISRYFDWCFIMNDDHKKNDPEFTIMPPHSINGSIDTIRMNNIEKRIRSKYLIVLNKQTLSALDSECNKKSIFYSNADIYCVAGFAGLDVLHTLESLRNFDKKAFAISDCIGDLTPETKEYNIEKISKICKVIKKEELDESFSIL